RVAKSSGPSLDEFVPPRVADAPIQQFDDHGFGDEPNNRAAVGALTGYRALRWGPHVDLILTDLHSYRSEVPGARTEADVFASPDLPQLVPEEACQIWDAGRSYAGGRPPATLRYGEKVVPNFRRDGPPQTILGCEQKSWFLARLKESRATWKIWGCSLG